jgi:hypothetical protein
VISSKLTWQALKQIDLTGQADTDIKKSSKVNGGKIEVEKMG